MLKIGSKPIWVNLLQILHAGQLEAFSVQGEVVSQDAECYLRQVGKGRGDVEETEIINKTFSASSENVSYDGPYAEAESRLPITNRSIQSRSASLCIRRMTGSPVIVLTYEPLGIRSIPTVQLLTLSTVEIVRIAQQGSANHVRPG